MPPLDEPGPAAERPFDGVVARPFTGPPARFAFLLRIFDLAIRGCAAVVVVMLGMPMLLLVSIMATDTGTSKAMVAGLCIFLGGSALFAGIAFLAVLPESLAKRIPGPRFLGKALARLPTYPVGTVGMAVLFSQLRQVAIPDLLRHH